MLISSTVKRGRYHDSVTLMAVAKRLNTLPGVKEAAAVMGTKENKSILRDGGLWQESFSALGDTDLIVAVAGPDSVPLEAALREVETVLSELRAKTGKAKANPRTLEAALTELPGANLAMISVAGKYASREARLALEHGLHVFLFSDNVPLEQEIALKREGTARGLLVMGPDCGTAIMNGVPLGFANVVRRGGIGVVAAAGTGLQEVTTLIHNAGGGVSQAIGTGGRDIKQEVGGLMCTMGLEALLADPATRVVVLISKPPHPSVVASLSAVLSAARKPVVVCFLGAAGGGLSGGYSAATLEETAAAAVRLEQDPILDLVQCRRDVLAALTERDAKAENVAHATSKRVDRGRTDLRGLFSGGTFCAEAQVLLRDTLRPLYSNVPLAGCERLSDARRSLGHTVVDLGEDEFTVGRPHPMIDYSLRNERILREVEDPATAVILLDVVLGWGSHPDPGEELRPAIETARAKKIEVLCSVTGTDEDPQHRGKVVEVLERAGAWVLPSNASACRCAGEVVRTIAEVTA